jgi:hypothetical protein
MGSKGDRTTEGKWAKGNAAATRHGLRASLCLSGLPKGSSGLRKRINGLRRELEAKVRETFGREPTAQEREAIQLVQQYERRRLLAEWWMRRSTDAGTMNGETFLGLLRIADVALAERLKLERELLRPTPGPVPAGFLGLNLNGHRPGQAAPGIASSDGISETLLNAPLTPDIADAILGALETGSDQASELADK